MSDTLWDHDEPIRALGVDVPRWIDQDITPADVAAILQGGCESGAYMPAVTYHTATRTMGEYGEEVSTYIDEAGLDITFTFDPREEWWGGLACKVLSLAVELWAASVEDEVREALENPEKVAIKEGLGT